MQTLIALNGAAKVFDMRRALYWLVIVSLLGSGWVHAAHDHFAPASVEADVGSLIEPYGGTDVSHHAHDPHTSDQDGCDEKKCQVCAAFVTSAAVNDDPLWIYRASPLVSKSWPSVAIPVDPLLLRRDRPPR
jgi:hypothetical protein